MNRFALWKTLIFAPLLAATLVACPSKVTGIDASATPATIPSGGSSSLTAVVSGTGSFNPGVNWSITSGGGSLSSNTGASVTFTAPSVTTNTTVQIKAEAVGDPSISKPITVTVQAAIPNTGTLALNIIGPSGVTAFAPNVSVSGVAAPVTSLGNQNLTVTVGNTTVTVNPVTVAGTFVDTLFSGYIDISGKPSSSTVSIAQGAASNLSVRYDGAGFSGKLWTAKNGTNFYGYADTVLTGGSGAVTPTSTLGAGTLFRDIAFDKSGNLWITDGSNKVQEYNPSLALVQTITATAAKSLNNPVGIAFDPAGNLWVSNYSGHTLVKYDKSAISAGTGINAFVPNATISTVPTATYYQIAFDATGNLWAIDSASVPSKLYKFDAASLTSNPTPSVTMTLQTNIANGISIDNAGKLWVSDSGGVRKYDPPTASGTPTPLLTLNRTGGFKTVTATGFDKAGNLWVCDAEGIYEFSAEQIATSSTTLTVAPVKSFTPGTQAYTMRFYPIPTDSPIYH
jgi:streptogramin lyase